MGPVEPKGASGYGPKAAPDAVGEPDYAALARGEPGFPTGPQAGPDVPSGSSAIAQLPPSVTGATSGVAHTGVNTVLPAYEYNQCSSFACGSTRYHSPPNAAASKAIMRLVGCCF